MSQNSCLFGPPAGNKVMIIGGQPEMQQFSNEVHWKIQIRRTLL